MRVRRSSKKIGAVQVNGIDVGAECAEVVNARIYVSLRAKIIHAEIPPPITEVWIVVLVKDILAVHGHGFIQPRAVLVAADQAKPHWCAIS